MRERGSASPATAASSTNASCLADGSCGDAAAFPDGTPPSRDRPPTARREKTDPTPARPDPDAPVAHPPPRRSFVFPRLGPRRARITSRSETCARSFGSSSAAPSETLNPLLPPPPLVAPPAGSALASGSPCPPAPNAICLTLPYAADVGGAASSDPFGSDASGKSSPGSSGGASPLAPCSGAFVTRAACVTLRFADAFLRFADATVARSSGDTRKEGRVYKKNPSALDVLAAKSSGAATFVESADVEFDHSSTLMCRARANACGAVYGLQREYNETHAAMLAASEAAEAAFDAYEATRRACDENTEALREIEDAARRGEEVCRVRVRTVESELVDALEAARANLVSVEGEGAGMCDRSAAVRASSEMEADALAKLNAAERAKGARGKVVGVSSELYVEEEAAAKKKSASSAAKKSKSPTFPPVRLPSGYLVPEPYFDACGDAVASVDALLSLVSDAQTVRERTCSEYTAEEIAAFRADAKRICGQLPDLKYAYARALERARELREKVEKLYAALLAAEEAARRKILNLDKLIGETAAAGGNEAAKAELERREATASRPTGIPHGSCAIDPANVPGSARDKPHDPAAKAALDRRAIGLGVGGGGGTFFGGKGSGAAKEKERITFASLVALADAYADAGASPSPQASASLARAFAGALAAADGETDSSRPTAAAAISAYDASRAIRALASAGAGALVGDATVPGSLGAALARVIASDAASMPSHAAVAVMGAYASAGVPVPSIALDAATDALTRDASSFDVADVAEALGAFARATRGAAALPPRLRSALDAAAVASAKSAAPAEIASAVAGYRAANEAAAPEALTAELGEVQDATQVAAALRAFRDFGATYAGSPLAPNASTRSALGRSLEAIFARQKQLDAVRAKDVLDVLDAHAACGAIPPAPNAVDALGGAAAAAAKKGSMRAATAARLLRAFADAGVRVGVAGLAAVEDALGDVVVKVAARMSPADVAATLAAYAAEPRRGGAGGGATAFGGAFKAASKKTSDASPGAAVTKALLAALRDAAGRMRPDDAAASLEALEKLPHVGAGVAEDVRAALRGAAEGGSAARGGRGAEP